MTYTPIHYPDVQAWVRLAPGEFTLEEIGRYFLHGAYDSHINRMDLIVILEDMAETGELERVGNKRGRYRPPKSELVKMDIANVEAKPEPIFLPFGASRFVSLYPGSIVTIGGEKNAGKTGLLLNLAFDNREDYKVHYFNSEMGPEETKVRCLKYCEAYRVGFSEWDRVDFYERSGDFADVIFSGKGHLNIVDFYECHDEFFKMGSGIRDIHDKLDGALCVIAIQKNPGNDLPLGGSRVTEKSRLHCSVSYNYGASYPHKFRIDVGKNWAQEGVNPRGLYVNYRLGGGCFLKGQEILDSENKPTVWQVEKAK